MGTGSSFLGIEVHENREHRRGAIFDGFRTIVARPFRFRNSLDRSCQYNCYYVAGKNGCRPAFDGSILPSIDSGISWPRNMAICGRPPSLLSAQYCSQGGKGKFVGNARPLTCVFSMILKGQIENLFSFHESGNEILFILLILLMMEKLMDGRTLIN